MDWSVYKDDQLYYQEYQLAKTHFTTKSTNNLSWHFWLWGPKWSMYFWDSKLSLNPVSGLYIHFLYLNILEYLYFCYVLACILWSLKYRNWGISGISLSLNKKNKLFVSDLILGENNTFMYTCWEMMMIEITQISSIIETRGYCFSRWFGCLRNQRGIFLFFPFPSACDWKDGLTICFCITVTLVKRYRIGYNN